jgi:glycosyltransferase involved in cell wall biosynthesis
MKNGYIPQEKRKKILLLSDDLRLPSGVGVMSKEIVMGTAHIYNWVQLGAAVSHPEAGKIMDASSDVNKAIGIEDAYVRIFPYNGYGDSDIIRKLMSFEKPDAILHFTDPRYWIWLYHMERELREHVPIMYYALWDSTPYPKYNKNYYKCSDSIFGISLQSQNIHKQVLGEGNYSEIDKPDTIESDKVLLKYIPHGINTDSFFRVTDEEGLKRVAEMKSRLFQGEEVDFVVMYNNRNIRRKMTGDVVLAYREFFLSLPREKANKCRLLLHTQPIDENGTDLIALIQDLAPEIKVTFSTERLDTPILNDLYNVADMVINIASNEGFGLGTLEALMAEKMILVNVTGGLQDQCGFKNGERYVNESDFTYDWGTNTDGRFKECGEWAVPVFPSTRSLNGSPPTPYIFDDRCKWEDVAEKLTEIYELGKEERIRRGALGRQFAIEQGFSAEEMCNRFIDGIETTMKVWKPRERFELIEA